MDSLSLDKRIEGLLFWKGEDFSISQIAKTLEVKESEVKEGIDTLRKKLEDRGIALVEKDGRVMLRTHPDMSELIEKMTQEELTKDLSKAALETLTIILYRGPVKRSEIDYIRGVNSQFILRSLSIRGLVEKVTNPKDERGFLYKPSFELLSYLGISRIEDLPEYDKVQSDIEDFINNEDGGESDTK